MKTKSLYIYGRQPIKEILETQPKNIYRIYIKETAQSEFFQDIIDKARQSRIIIQKVPDKKLTELVGDVNDQGIVASIREFIYTDLHEWLGSLSLKKNPAIMLLDEIEDPHNVGAIIRSAAAFGMSAVLLPSHRQAGITSTVFKTSAGAVAKIPVIQIGNINQTVDLLKEKGFWIAGLSGEETAQKLWATTFDAPFVFVIGGEGKGIREKTKERCDFLIQIPIHPEIESLNASVAAGVAGYEWKRQQKTKGK